MNIIITGTSSGIGFTLANYLMEKGNNVIGLSRRTPKNANFKTINCDITDKNQVINAINEIKTNFNSIDILISNAGMGMVGSIENTQEEEIIKLFKLNVVSCITLINEILPVMREQKFGKIINISSIGSEMGLPFRGFYSASKSALDKITEALRYEISNFNVQATVVHLGDIQTNIAESRVHSTVPKAYETIFQKVYNSMNSHVDDGITTSEVAEFIHQLTKKRVLKSHYYCGKFMQKISVSLKKFLPSNWFEKIIKKYSNL
ncbi:MAG: SDR family NAD(P)-dependent oxidoreductase [Flavobacteriales bacterium]|nr:SDR family NAD(P)-dependent oxidoreductase [Flavobacteriales bacterium]